MLPTFTIGLREGLEAAVILVLLATLARRDQAGVGALRRMWGAVAVAGAGCAALAAVLGWTTSQISPAAQHAVEAVLALVAAATLTSTVLWTARHALGGAPGAHLGRPGLLAPAAALVPLAVLAVTREGVEAAVFLTTLEPSTRGPEAVAGLALGVLAAAAAGVGAHRLARLVRPDRFVALCQAVLVLVAAGLVALSLRTAHEAGWLTVGQGQLVDLSGLAHPESVPAAVVTGVLGISVAPTWAEATAWALYLGGAAALCLAVGRRAAGRHRWAGPAAGELA